MLSEPNHYLTTTMNKNQYQVRGYTKTGIYCVIVESVSMEAALAAGKRQIKEIAFSPVRSWVIDPVNH